MTFLDEGFFSACDRVLREVNINVISSTFNLTKPVNSGDRCYPPQELCHFRNLLTLWMTFLDKIVIVTLVCCCKLCVSANMTSSTYNFIKPDNSKTQAVYYLAPAVTKQYCHSDRPERVIHTTCSYYQALLLQTASNHLWHKTRLP